MSRILLRHFAIAFLTIAACTTSGEIIYRETFGIPPGTGIDADALAFDWQRFDNNGNAASGPAVNFSAVSRLANVANINAGPNSDGTLNAYTNGIFYLGQNPSPSLGLTTEFNFNPVSYVPGSLIFSWYEGNNSAPHVMRLIVRVGVQWYASMATFSTPAVLLANFGAQSQLKTLTYDPAPANWVTLNFNGNYIVGVTNGSGTATSSTLGALALGGNPGAPLSGNITGFGVYGINGGGTGNRRIDTFTIEGTPADVAPGISVDLTNKLAELCANSFLVIGATGSPPLSYQWFFNNSFIGGNSNSLPLLNLNSTHAGNYFVVVSNATGVATSSVAALTLTDTTPPTITQCANTPAVVADALCQAVVPNLTNQIIATDCSGIISITQNPPGGTIVGGGSHIITFSITDASNNVATCQTTFLVADDTAPRIVMCATNVYLNADLSQQAVIPDLRGSVTVTNRCNTAVIHQNPAPGTVVGPGSHQVTLTATTFANNIDQCAVTVFVNARPVAVNQSMTNGIDQLINLALGGSDAEGGPIMFEIRSQPTNGVLGPLTGNLVSYTPTDNFAGLDSFTFVVSDWEATSAVATVSLVVTNAHLPYPSGPQIAKDGAAILLTNYASAPNSSRTFTTYPPVFNPDGQMSRINFMRPEPTNAPGFGSRYFVCDLNRNIYILPKSNPLATNTWLRYLNFEEVFPRFDNDPGFAGGLTTFAFDPEYATNGLFYTVHMETTASTLAPTNGALPGLNLTGYTTTTAINPPSGAVGRIAVLIEWRDTNIANTTFEGTAREVLRLGFFSTIHPLGDLVFNPLARPGAEDYRNLYIAVGDGRAGETAGATHTHPQRLDALVGKILRITPDINLRPADELSANGRYRIPVTGTNSNPFVALTLPGVRKEIFAYGFRNPHRLSWDSVTGKLFVNDIGYLNYEEVNIVRRGGNYGYAEREGAEELFIAGGAGNGLTGSQRDPAVPFPLVDLLTVTNAANGVSTNVVPIYPVAYYSHRDGDAISSGFVYRGALLPQLRNKYIFGDITTGRLFYCDLDELLAADDGKRATYAPIHEIQVAFDSPRDTPNQGITNRRLFDIVAEEYRGKGGTSETTLPGAASATDGVDPQGIPYGGGRSDIRLTLGDDQELYIISKSDGMIRKVIAALHPPDVQASALLDGNVALHWRSVPGWRYRVQYKTNLADLQWLDFPGDVTAIGLTAGKTNAPADGARFFRVKQVP